MEMKEYEVTMHIEAPNRKTVEQMLDGMPHSDRILDDKITCTEDRFLQARIRYVEEWDSGCGEGPGEYYFFENKWSDETEWGLDCAFRLFDYKGEKGILLNYQALTKIRELNKLQIPFYFC